MSLAVSLTVLGALLVALFLKLRGYAYPHDGWGRQLQPEALAVAQARTAVQRLCGLDVTGWRAYPAVTSDEEASELLHQLGTVEEHRRMLEAWGLRGSWRVRFVGAGATVRVGLSFAGEVVLLDLDHEAELLVSDRTGPAPDDVELRRRLGGRLWQDATLVGRGERAQDGALDRTRMMSVRGPDLRLEAVVRTTGSAVMQIHTVAAPASDRARAVERDGATESLSGLGGMLGSLLALAVGIGILAQLGGPAGRTDGLLLSAALAVTLVTAVLVTEPKDLNYLVIDAYDGRTSWRVFRITTLMTALCTGVAMAGVAAVAALAGTRVAAEVAVPLLGGALGQLGWGVFLAAAWLGLAAAGWALLRRAGAGGHAASPDPRMLRQDPIAGLRAVTVAVQSSIGEEAVYRLLAVPVILWVTGSPVVAVVLSAVLWAAMHSGSAVRPRWMRFAELTVIGCGLGAAMLTIGFLAPLVAHAVFNAATLLAALVPGDRPAPRREREWSEPAFASHPRGGEQA